jgi:DNA-binding SARP family transcriptional activator
MMLAGRHGEARQHFDRALVIARRISSQFSEFNTLTASAWSHFDEGNIENGLSDLRAAMAIAAANSYTNTWFWIPRVMSDLCARAFQAGIETEYVTRLVRHRGLVAQSPSIEKWPWPVKVYTLGRFSLVVDGHALAFARKAQKKPIALLKAIVAHGGRGVEHTTLVDDIWPELDGDAARNALDLGLHRLRRLLGRDDTVTVGAGKIALDERLVWVDAWAFERLCGDITRGGGGFPKTAALAAAERALRLYPGPFLQGEQEPWAIATRDRMRSKLLRALEELGRALERSSAWDQVITVYRCALEVEPLGEAFHGGLMLGYAAQERFGEALAAYERCRDLLRASLGIEPSRRLRLINESIRERAGARRDNGS